MLAQLTQVPLLPVAYAAARAWQLRSWDRFLIPKPFTRIVIAVGAPVHVPKGISVDALGPVQQQMEEAINHLMADARGALHP